MGSLGDKMKASGGRPSMGAISFTTAILNTIALLLIARNMGPEILGTLGFILSFFGMLFFLGDMGNTMAFESVVAKGYRFSECYRAYVIAKLKLTVSMSAVFGIMIAIYTYALAPATHTALHPVSMILMLGYFLTANLGGIWVASLSIKAGRTRANIFDFIESIAKVSLVASVIFWTETSGDQDAIFQITMIYLLAGTLGMMIARNSARRLKRGEGNEEIEVEFQDMAAKILPFAAFSSLILGLDKVILWYFTDFGTVGVYFGAQRITIFIAAAAVSIEILLGSALARYVRENNTKAISDTLRMTERYVSLIVLPVACFYIVFAEGLLNAFLGEEFAGAGVTVALLAGAGFFTAMASPHVSYLSKAKHFRELAISGGIALAALCIVMLTLIPDLVLPEMDIHGMNGAATAILSCSLVFYATARSITWKMLDCRPHRRILSHIFCAGLMIAFIDFIIWYFDISLNFGWLVFLAMVGTFIYVLALYLSGEMLKRDFSEFTELTKPE